MEDYVEMLPAKVKGWTLRIKRRDKNGWRIRYLRRRKPSATDPRTYDVMLQQSGKTLQHAAKLMLEIIKKIND